MENLELSDEIKRGKKKLINFIVFFIILSIASKIFAYSTFNTFTVGGMYKTVIGFILEIGLLYAVYLGRAWAKYILVLLLAIGLLFGLIQTIPLLKVTLLGLIMFPLFILYAYGLFLLLVDKDFSSFFDYQTENSY
jgi:hypothetical protein